MRASQALLNAAFNTQVSTLSVGVIIGDAEAADSMPRYFESLLLVLDPSDKIILFL